VLQDSTFVSAAAANLHHAGGMLASLLLFLVLSGCDAGNAGAGSGKAGAAQARSGPFSRGPTLVVVKPASIRSIKEEVEAIGTTLANESVILTAQVTDTISKVRFEDGDYVEAGEILVELTNEEETALLAESNANREDADTQFRRLENLLRDGSVPISQVDEARSRVAAADARYQSVVARLDDRLIRAPFSGILGFRQVSPGTLVSPGTAITSLDDVSIIKLDFSLPEVYLSLVEPGMHLTAESSAFRDRRFDATVSTIGSRVDPVTRAATIRAHIDNRDLKLRPGMLLTVRLTTAERQALMVPETAMLQRASQSYVYTVKDGRAEMVQIQRGARYDGWVEVLDGVAAGDPVVAEGVIKIRNGSEVSAQNPEAAAFADQERS